MSRKKKKPSDVIHICSFSTGIDELPRKQQKDKAAVLKAMAAAGRFSVFEATANQTIAGTITGLQEGEYFLLTSGAYPWCNIEITDKGHDLMATTGDV